MSMHGNYKSHPNRNWLGHRRESAAAELDSVLIDGATGKVLATIRTSWQDHLRHLINERGVHLVCNDKGVWVIVE